METEELKHQVDCQSGEIAKDVVSGLVHLQEEGMLGLRQ